MVSLLPPGVPAVPPDFIHTCDVDAIQISQGQTQHVPRVDAGCIQHTPCGWRTSPSRARSSRVVPHLVSGSCASPRACGLGFLQTPPHGRRPGPAPRLRLRAYLARGLAPRSCCAMPGTHARFQPPLEAVGCIPLLRRSSCKRRPVAHQHDLASHASRPEPLLRVSGLGKRTSLRDERLDLLLLQEVQQGDQILSKPCRSQPFEPLDAVGDHPFPATEKPAASDVQPEDGDATKAMTTTWTTGSQSPPRSEDVRPEATTLPPGRRAWRERQMWVPPMPSKTTSTPARVRR